MNECIHCGKPLTQLPSTTQRRSDRKYCNDVCKMRFNRANKKRLSQAALGSPVDYALGVVSPTKAKSSWRPLFPEPVYFNKTESGQSNLTKYGYNVAAEEWQDYMVGLNQLCSLLGSINDCLELQGSICKNDFEEDGSDDSGCNWCGYFSQFSRDLPQLETRLKQRASIRAFLKPHMPQLSQWIRDMILATRFFVFENHRRTDEFQVNFEESFITQMQLAKRQIAGLWFDLEALHR